MRLVDQTRVNPFYVRTHGEQPVEDGLPSPLPAEVERPPSWPHASALMIAGEANAAGDVLANIVTPSPNPRAPVDLRSFWVVWRADGSLVRELDAAHDGERLIDARWAGGELLELRWSAEDVDDYHLVLGDRRARFAIAWAPDTRLSAQALAPLRAPAHWVVHVADGHGAFGFDIIELGAMTIERRFAMTREHGEPLPGARAMAEDGTIVFATSGDPHARVHVLEAGRLREIPLVVTGEPDDWSLELTKAALVIRADDRVATYPRPLVGPFAI